MIPTYSIEAFTEHFLSGMNKYKQLDSEILLTAQQVILDIRSQGDKALASYVKKFDGEVPAE